jgi:hypothetical protein
MGILRNAVDCAVGEVIAEHPKYFTPKGVEHARNIIVRKVMAALRDGAEELSEPAEADAPQHRVVAANSAEACGYKNLRALAGCSSPYEINGALFIPPTVDGPAVMALVDLPSREKWLFLTDRAQIGAWIEFISEKLPNTPRRSLIETRNGQSGILMPYPWPPSATGKIYEAESA